MPIRKSNLLLAAILAAAFVPSSLPAQDTPEKLRAPENEKLILELHANGDQIYTCKNDGTQFAWTLKAPDAQLFDKDGNAFGKHFAGPSWQSNDGSRVTAKAVATSPSPDPASVPWLLLTVVTHDGTGALSRATSIQRVNTKGGKAPSSGCDAQHANAETRAPYTADYRFYAPK